MIVEHVFVTTLGSSEAIRLACDLLERRGFVRQADGASSSPGDGIVLVFTRGHVKPRQAKSISELRQQVQIEWLRGRVTVAVSIEPFGHTATSGFTQRLPENSPKAKLHVALLMAIAQGLDSLLAGQKPPQEAGLMWDGVEQAIAEDARRQRRKQRIVLSGCLLSLVVFVGLIVIGVVMSSR
jgi:hypothetical protein